MGNQRKFPKYCVLDLFIYIVWTGISETHGQIFLVSSLSKTFRTTIIFPFAPGVLVFTRAARDLVIRPIMPTDLVLESEAYLNTWFAISNLSLVFCLDFMAFWRLPLQPNVVFDLFYSLHPSWRRLGSSLVVYTWCFVVVNISLFNVIFI